MQARDKPGTPESSHARATRNRTPSHEEHERGQHLDRLEQKRVESGLMSSGAGDDEGDLTRKQRREQARGERKALEQAEAARAKRRARLTQLGIVVAIIVVVIVGIA